MWDYVIYAICMLVGFFIGLHIKNEELKEKDHTIDGYFVTMNVGVPPIECEDASGRKMYRCKKCYKRVYQSLRHCPECAQRIDWSGKYTQRVVNKENKE